MSYSNVTVTATFKIPETPVVKVLTGKKSKPDSIGDIVFEDGSATAWTKGLTLTEKQKSKAVAVIFYTPLNDSMLGVAIHNTHSKTKGQQDFGNSIF